MRKHLFMHITRSSRGKAAHVLVTRALLLPVGGNSARSSIVAKRVGLRGPVPADEWWTRGGGIAGGQVVRGARASVAREAERDGGRSEAIDGLRLGEATVEAFSNRFAA